MRLAGVTRAYIVLREGKWDIPAYLGDGTMLNMHLAYLMMRLPFGAPYTLDQAYPFVQDALVAFGFPDIIFQPDDAFVQLLARQAAIRVSCMNTWLLSKKQTSKILLVTMRQSSENCL
jgi:glucose-1-phosphate thymidylyltransferase